MSVNSHILVQEPGIRAKGYCRTCQCSLALQTVRQPCLFFCELFKKLRLNPQLNLMCRACQWFLLILLCQGSVRAEELFPLPAELERDVAFWTAIFTEYGTDEGVLHDNRDLSIIYARVDVAPELSRRARRQLIEKHRDRIKAVLRRLQTGKRDNLSDEESSVLALWPDGVSNQVLAAAAKRIRFQQGLKDRFRDGLVRAGRWRDFIEREFAALSVPIDLAALPHVESSYNPDARSHVGASGIWQFTRSTGRRYMRVDHVIDERNDPFLATRAAARLLAYNYSIVGNWPMAVTAYNHGLAGVRRAARQYGESAYADILRKYNGRTFGFASRNFYVAFLAARQVDQNVDQYFPDLVIDPPLDYEWLALPAYIPAARLASGLGVTPAALAAHNPALQPTVWQGSKHLPSGFEFKLPVNGFAEPLATLIAGIPADAWATSQLPDMFHKVVRGDTLSEIATAYDTRVSTLVALNNLGSSHRIRAGQQLRLPAAGPAPPPRSSAAINAAAVEELVVASVATPPPRSSAATNAAAVEAAVVASVATPPADIATDDELVPPTMTADFAATPVPSIQAALLSDPSDYSVATNSTIEVQPLETLGHYADWLGIRTQRLRDINGLAFRDPVEVGRRIKLDFTDVDAKSFEDRRTAYQREQQDGFFRQHIITGVREHVISRGESIWILALREYDVPVWLFRQYNPELDLHNVQPGVRVQFPVLTPVDRS